MKRLLIAAAILGCMLTGTAEAQETQSNTPTIDMLVKAVRGGTADIELPGKVFLRNKYSLKGSGKSEGASSSLVIKDDKVYVLTAKHLLGEAMGITPEVLPTSFDDKLKKWKVIHNDDGKTVAKVTSIYKPNDNMDEDIILLETDADPDTVKEYTLKIAKAKPQIGDKLYVIGCPYSAPSCAQRAYAGKVATFTNFDDDPAKPQNLIVLDMTHAPDRLAGFSGAAMINEDMEIVAVVFGGQRIMIAGTLLPDWTLD